MNACVLARVHSRTTVQWIQHIITVQPVGGVKLLGINLPLHVTPHAEHVHSFRIASVELCIAVCSVCSAASIKWRGRDRGREKEQRKSEG